MNALTLLLVSASLLGGALALTPTASACAEGAPMCDMVYECPFLPVIGIAGCMVENANEVRCALIDRPLC